MTNIGTTRTSVVNTNTNIIFEIFLGGPGRFYFFNTDQDDFYSYEDMYISEDIAQNIPIDHMIYVSQKNWYDLGLFWTNQGSHWKDLILNLTSYTISFLRSKIFFKQKYDSLFSYFR